MADLGPGKDERPPQAPVLILYAPATGVNLYGDTPYGMCLFGSLTHLPRVNQQIKSGQEMFYGGSKCTMKSQANYLICRSKLFIKFLSNNCCSWSLRLFAPPQSPPFRPFGSIKGGEAFKALAFLPRPCNEGYGERDKPEILIPF